VKVAVGLLGGVLVVNIARIPFLHFGLVGPFLQAVFLFGVFGSVCVCALGVALVAAIAFGRRWALIVFVVFFVLGLPELGLSATRQLHSSVPGFGWLVASTAVEALAISLLFSRSAREWFARATARQVAFDPHTGRRLDWGPRERPHDG
jgi:hypothetical protein